MIVLMLIVIALILLGFGAVLLRVGGVVVGSVMASVGVGIGVWAIKQVPIWVWITLGSFIAVSSSAIWTYDWLRKKRIMAEYGQQMASFERQRISAENNRTKFQGNRLSKERRKQLSESVRVRPSVAHKEAPTFPPGPNG